MSSVIIPPAGTSPAGLTAPSIVFAGPTRPPPILADDIDGSSGELRSVLRGLHPVDAMVITAIRTRRGSGAAVPATGNRLHTIDKVDDEIATGIRFELELALERLVRARDIRIERVEVVVDGDAAQALLTYVNLRTAERRQVRA